MTYTDYTPKVVNTAEVQGVAADGTLQKQLRVTFTVGDKPSQYTIQVPADFDPMQVKAQMQAYAEKLRALCT